MYFVQRVTQCCFKRILVASCFIFDNICFIRNIYFLAHQSLFYIHCKILSSKYFSFTSFFYFASQVTESQLMTQLHMYGKS